MATFDITLYPPEQVRERARNEVEIMRILQKQPMKTKQLMTATGLSRSAVKSIVRDLVDAEVVHRRFDDLIILDSGEFLHLEPDPSFSWMQR